MLALAVVICESVPLALAGSPVSGPDETAPDDGEVLTPAAPSAWQAEARFMVANADELLDLLHVSGTAGRPHPPQLSTQVSADLLFEDGDITGETWLARPELTQLMPHAAQELRERMKAWDAFLAALEDAARATRLIIWFIR